MPFRTYAQLIAVILIAGGLTVAAAALAGRMAPTGGMALSGAAVVLAGLAVLRLLAGKGRGE
jgi:ribulose 1,5-bisphosphate synthetase/thiazole synthase